MTRGPHTEHLTLLERLDLAMAARLLGDLQVGTTTDVDCLLADWQPPRVDAVDDAEWIAEVLRLRGYAVLPSDAADILQHKPGRFAPDHQEFLLILGLAAVLDHTRERAAAGFLPDGDSSVALFRILTERIARFRNNTLRRDMPWDGVLYVPYPDAGDVPGLLEDFCRGRCYGEDTAVFESLHPVRQAVRLMWRFARIAPFPDLNIVIGFAVMNGYLIAHGYPRIVARRGDRELLARLIRGAPPPRIVQFESRLLGQLD